MQGIDYRRIALAHDRQAERLLAELGTLRERLSLARAGLLIALAHVEPPAARMLVAYALEASDVDAGRAAADDRGDD